MKKKKMRMRMRMRESEEVFFEGIVMMMCLIYCLAEFCVVYTQ